MSSFLEIIYDHDVLGFGAYTLKSGRESPFFFNAGNLCTGDCLPRLGKFYAEKLVEDSSSFDVIFGPAYKGIFLATATLYALSQNHSINAQMVYNRKEVKDHGERGLFVGAIDALERPECRVMIIDDVLTAGTAVEEAIQLLKMNFPSCKIAGVLVAFDREERGSGDETAAMELQTKYDIPVTSIIKFRDILEFVEKQTTRKLDSLRSNEELFLRLQEYRSKYGANTEKQETTTDKSNSTN